uniref:Uncharacterized protein n=1 Tax=viral metagenome TaxID=1070528 RepID=A0A6C0HA85_9ZZZZ
MFDALIIDIFRKIIISMKPRIIYLKIIKTIFREIKLRSKNC